MNVPVTTPAVVRIGNREFPFTSFEDVSAAYRATIDKLGLGASQTPRCDILDAAGVRVARVSYNGNVWPAEDWFPGQEPLLKVAGLWK